MGAEPWELDSVGAVVIGGKDRIVQLRSSNRYEPVPGTFKNGLQVVEGAGNMCGTFEFFVCKAPFMRGDTDVFDLNRVIESDGTITYEQYEPVPMIREDRCGSIISAAGRPMSGMWKDCCASDSKGTVERNGTEYHRLIDLDTEETVALMREEYRQVYIPSCPKTRTPGKGREALLYDFGYRMLAGVESVAFRGMTGTTFSETLICIIQSASHLYGTP